MWSNNLATGEVTLEDVYRFFPVSYPLATGVTSGLQLKTIMEQNLSYVFSVDSFQQSGGWLDGFSGVDLTLDLTKNDAQRIAALFHGGSNTEISDTDSVTVAGCQRPFDNADILCSYPGFTNVQALIDVDTGNAMTPQALLIKSLANGNLTGGKNSGITDISGTTQWPEADFVQPLTGVN